MASLIIDIIVDPASQLVFRENVMQIADSTSKAIGGAVYLWSFSVFTTVFAWLDDEGCPGHMVGREEREFVNEEGVSRPWRIYSSPFMMMGDSDNTEENRVQEQQSDYKPTTLPLIEPFLPDICRTDNVSGIKVFLMNSGVGEIHGDCTVNGVSLLNLLESVKRFQWPPGQGLRSLRQYHVIAPADFKIDMTIPQVQATPEKSGLLSKWFGKN